MIQKTDDRQQTTDYRQQTTDSGQPPTAPTAEKSCNASIKAPSGTVVLGDTKGARKGSASLPYGADGSGVYVLDPPRGSVALGSQGSRKSNASPGAGNAYYEGGDDGSDVHRATPSERNGGLVNLVMVDGHAVACGDLAGTGGDQVVVGWRAMNRPGVKVGIKLFTPTDASGEKWESILVDDNTVACEDLVLADLDANGKLDIVAAGRATKNLKIYLNQYTRTGLIGPCPMVPEWQFLVPSRLARMSLHSR